MNQAYISGGISGISPDAVRSAFDKGVTYAVSMGYDVTDPSLLHMPTWTWEDYMTHWLCLLPSMSIVVMLPNWRASKGACAERDCALQLGIPVVEMPA